MLIVQISDPHVLPDGWLAFGAVDTAAMLERAVDAVLALDPAPDAVLLTGDLVAEPWPEAYKRAVRSLARLRAPLYPIPGNHDDRVLMRRCFGESGLFPSSGRLHYSLDLGDLRLICLDSLVEGSPWGELGEAQVAWLDRTLSGGPRRPTLLALHHPPFRTGIGHMDWSMLRDADALAAVVGRHPEIERVLCGHVHRHVVRRWAGTIAEIAPGVAHAVKLVLGAERGPWIVEPPMMLLHYWSEATGLVSHAHLVGPGGPEGRFKDPHQPPSAAGR